MDETSAAIERVIQYLNIEFIVEGCVGNSTEGCISCEMIETRASLRKVLYMIEEEAALSQAIGNKESGDDR